MLLCTKTGFKQVFIEFILMKEKECFLLFLV